MVEKLECLAVSADDLSQILRAGDAIVVDVRSSNAFQASHICGALSVRNNPLLLRRLNKGTLTLNDLLLDPERRWSQRADDDMVVLYDDASAFDGPIDYDAKSMLHAALRSLLFCGLNCVFLHGKLSCTCNPTIHTSSFFRRLRCISSCIPSVNAL